MAIANLVASDSEVLHQIQRKRRKKMAPRRQQFFLTFFALLGSLFFLCAGILSDAQ